MKRYSRFSLRAPEGFQKRLKLAAVEAGVPMSELLEQLLDDRDRRLRKARSRQLSPLHRVSLDDD